MLADESLRELRGLVAGMGGLLLVGLLDDFHELSARSRFLAQIGAALLMATWGGVRLEDFGVLFFDQTLDLGWAAIPVTVLCTVGVINAVNMIDGLDGLAGSLVLLCLVAMGLRWGLVTDGPQLHMLLVTGAAILGFLLFNLRIGRRSGSVFLGDAGSQALGFLLAWLLIEGSQGPARVFAPVTALWMLAIPLIDTVFVMIRRLRAGQSPFASGRDHLHHLFLRSGFGAWSTLAAVAGMAAVLASVGLLMERGGVPEPARFFGFLLVCGVYYAVVDKAWAIQRWLGRRFRSRESRP
jgi:UDP-GlcNAc:undecaprenyl-phosphate GlcNAc-1-phosphate transferase